MSRHATADRPVHTGPGCCTGCWAVPGAEHGFACPALTPTRRRKAAA